MSFRQDRTCDGVETGNLSAPIVPVRRFIFGTVASVEAGDRDAPAYAARNR
ncbi:MAG: hypothetical protein ACYDHH_24615 [Solirubrobacteraceae bacterium]